MPADSVFLNARVLTMNPNQPIAQAVATEGGQIVRVGTNEEISQLIDRKTKIIRLDGKTVLPGFIDTHIHVLDFGRMLSWIDLTEAKSIPELQNCVMRRAENSPRGSWILGRGWNEARFLEKRMPTRSDLDLFAPDNPTILYHEMAQMAIVNTKALTLADITEETPNPPGGSIGIDPKTGEPTGILCESATNLVWRIVPEQTEEELLDATALACRKIVEAGITSIHWIVLNAVEISISEKLHFQNRLPLRVNLVLPTNLTDEIRNFKSKDNSFLRIAGIMVAADGYLAAKTAALTRPYTDDPEHVSDILTTREELTATSSKIFKAGYQLIVHAVGDKAIDVSLNAVEKALVSTQHKPRVRMEQAALVNDGLIERIRRQGIIISVQPLVISSEFSVWHAVEHLGIERARWLFPLKTFMDNDVRVIGGSDCPMEPLNPFLGIQAAVLRKHFREEQVTIEQALSMYTIDAAYSSGEEGTKGSIEPGKMADIIVLSKDPTLVPPVDLNEINVELVVIKGRIVYSKTEVSTLTK